MEKRRAENQDSRPDEQPLETIVELRTEAEDKPDDNSEVQNQDRGETTTEDHERPDISTETTEKDLNQDGPNEPENGPNEPANAGNAVEE